VYLSLTVNFVYAVLTRGCFSGIILSRMDRAMNDMWDKGTVSNIPVGAVVRKKLDGYIFRWRPGIGQERMEYYMPTNPRTAEQQLMRKVFADATAAWKALSEEEKGWWWQEAKKRGKLGPHYFQSSYIKTHPRYYGEAKVDFAVIGGDWVG